MDIRFVEAIRNLANVGLVEYSENRPLSEISSFRIGGNCKMVVYPKNAEALKKTVEAACSTNTRFAVFGRCSNVLFSDNGYSGVIICTTKMNSISKDGMEVTAACGVSLYEITSFCMRNGLSGFEFGYGIPGTVGGAVYMNAGAYEHSVSEILTKCSYYDVNTREIVTLESNQLDFSYRHSIFSGDEGKIILEATFRLMPGDSEAINAQMQDYMSRRKSKQPYDQPSAGSVFKRCEGHFTGKLIEDLGLKGFSVGGATVSERHAGFIVNKDYNATAEDVMKLVDIIVERVKDQYGLTLEREIIYFGD